MKFTLKLYPNEHKAIVELLLHKMNMQEFDRMNVGEKILYMQTLQSYQQRLQTQTVNRWNKPRKQISISFKLYEANQIVDVIYFGSYGYNDHLQNLARIINQQFHEHSINANHFLTTLKKQLDVSRTEKSPGQSHYHNRNANGIPAAAAED